MFGCFVDFIVVRDVSQIMILGNRLVVLLLHITHTAMDVGGDSFKTLSKWVKHLDNDLKLPLSLHARSSPCFMPMMTQAYCNCSSKEKKGDRIVVVEQ